jgi:hypothetical protein
VAAKGPGRSCDGTSGVTAMRRPGRWPGWDFGCHGDGGLSVVAMGPMSRRCLLVSPQCGWAVALMAASPRSRCRERLPRRECVWCLPSGVGIGPLTTYSQHKAVRARILRSRRNKQLGTGRLRENGVAIRQYTQGSEKGPLIYTPWLNPDQCWPEKGRPPPGGRAGAAYGSGPGGGGRLRPFGKLICIGLQIRLRKPDTASANGIESHTERS